MKYAPKELLSYLHRCRWGESHIFIKATYISWLSQCQFFSLKLRAFTDSRDDMALGHVVVLLQHEWPRGENLFLKAINKICQQGNFQYENFFNYVTSILSLTRNVFRIQNYVLGCWKSCYIVSAAALLCESYSLYFHTMQASCNRWQCTMDRKYGSCHLFWHLKVPLSTLQLHFHSAAA